MVRSSALAKPFVGSLLSLGAGWPASLPDSCNPSPILRKRSPWMFSVIGSRVTIGPGFVVVVALTPGAAAAAFPPPPRTNPFSPPRSPTAAKAYTARFLPLPPLAPSPSAAFFFATSRSFRGRGGRGIDLADGRIGAVGDVAQRRPHVGQYHQLHPAVGGAPLGRVVGRHRPFVGVTGGLEPGRGDAVPFDE